MACRTTKEFLSFRKYDNRFFRLLAEYVMYVAVEIRKWRRCLYQL